MNLTALITHKKKILGILLLVIGILVSTFPFLYYGYVEYVIGNSVAMLNIDMVNISLRQAAIHLFNGHPIAKVPLSYLFAIGVIGIITAYFGAILITTKDKSSISIFSSKYWKTFKLLP